MVRRPEDFSNYYQAVDRYGIHDIGGPLLAGGARFLLGQTSLASDMSLRQIITSNQRFRAYLRFRDQAFKIAVTLMYSTSKSPAVDFLAFTAADGKKFRFQYFYQQIVLREPGRHGIFMNDQSNGIDVDNLSTAYYLSNDENISHLKNRKELLLQKLLSARKYFAYRKGLLKLDFIKSDSDPEKVLKRIKSSAGWSELQDHVLRHYLKSHMDLLKEQEMSKQEPACRSRCEYKNLALEKINLELSSSLDNRLGYTDWMLMDQYYDRMRLKNVARECATEVQNAEVIIIEEALPVTVHSEQHILSTIPKVRMLHSIKQNVKQSLVGCMSSLHEKTQRFGSGGPRGKVWPLVAFSAVASLATMSNGKR